MKVAIVSFDGPPHIGGLGAVVASDEILLKESGYEVVTLSPHTDVATKLGFPTWLRRRHGRFLSCPLFSLWLHFALPKFIRETKPSALMIHTGSGGIFLLQRPSVLTLAIAHHTYRQECRYVFQPWSLRWIFRSVMSVLERITYSNVDRTLCVSSTTAESVIRDYRVQSSTVMVVENCVDRKWFDRSWNSPNKERHEPRVILSVGRLEERKGTLELLQALAALKDRCHFPVQLQLIGRNMMGSRLQEVMRALGIENSVTFFGHISDDERVKKMEACDLFVAPSKLEGFGLAAAEAMVMGVPVVLSAAPGLRTLAQDGVSGRVCDWSDPGHVSDVLYDCLRDTAKLHAYAARATALARGRFNPLARQKSLVAQIRSLFHSLER